MNEARVIKASELMKDRASAAEHKYHSWYSILFHLAKKKESHFLLIVLGEAAIQCL